MSNNLSTVTETVNLLYKQGKVCITAAKIANIDPSYRPFLAMFADGTFLVNEKAQNDMVIEEIVIDFCIKYTSHKRQQRRYVSPELLKAIYHKAQEFEWYQSQYPVAPNFNFTNTKMKHFLDRILCHPCLSITTITTPKWFKYYSPDKGKFALMSNGNLILAEDSPYINTLPAKLSAIYPLLNMVEIVPPDYISAIYETLLYTQPSAREIYISLVTHKIMEKYNLCFDEAHNLMKEQKFGWKKLLLLDEKTARSMIYSNHVEKCFAQSDEQ